MIYTYWENEFTWRVRGHTESRISLLFPNIFSHTLFSHLNSKASKCRKKHEYENKRYGTNLFYSFIFNTRIIPWQLRNRLRQGVQFYLLIHRLHLFPKENNEIYECINQNSKILRTILQVLLCWVFTFLLWGANQGDQIM